MELRNLKKKFKCTNHPKIKYFNEDTCREAILFWKKMAKKILNQFLTCNSTYRMLRDSLGAPIAFIRRIIHGAGKKVEQFLPPTLKSQEAITVIFADESTTGISQNWIYLSFVGDKVYWEINLNRKKENIRKFLNGRLHRICRPHCRIVPESYPHPAISFETVTRLCSHSLYPWRGTIHLPNDLACGFIQRQATEKDNSTTQAAEKGRYRRSEKTRTG